MQFVGKVVYAASQTIIQTTKATAILRGYVHGTGETVPFPKMESTTYFKGHSFEKGKGPRPELFCDNTCWNNATETCGCDGCLDFSSPIEVLREGRVGGHHRAIATDGGFAYTTTLEGIEIPFLRVCKDKNAGAVNNSQFALSTDKEKDFRDSEFIRKNKAAASNPSSRCGVDCQEVCPGVDPKTNVPCNGRGQCNNDCQCSCFSLDAISDRTYFLTALTGRRPWRGSRLHD